MDTVTYWILKCVLTGLYLFMFQYSEVSINRGPPINRGVVANSRFSNWVQNAGWGCINRGGGANLLFDPPYTKK